MKDFRELAEEIIEKFTNSEWYPISDAHIEPMSILIAEALSHQYERGVKDGYEKGFREAKQYGEVYEQELKKIGWNEAVEACEKVAEKRKILWTSNGGATIKHHEHLTIEGELELVVESIGKLRRE